MPLADFKLGGEEQSIEVPEGVQRQSWVCGWGRVVGPGTHSSKEGKTLSGPGTLGLPFSSAHPHPLTAGTELP